ncbi:MAG TPA: iron-sulfur cluster assembly accessory protein [Terriglobia bacterium]|nr:iron-sulfur cluster assembly accessory protein [Terriglobia bacterium]
MITLTERATVELKELLQSQDQAGSALRVWVQGGGCSGLSYGMALDGDKPDESDQIFEQDGIKIYVDPLSLNYMDGSSVDYVDDVLGGGFKIENPNAVSSCGCGSSFKTADSGGAGCGSCSHAK